MSDAEKDALLLEQAEMIQRLATRIAELEAILRKPLKASSDSHTPPSQDGPGRAKRPKRRGRLKDSTLAAFAATANNKLDRLVAWPVAHPAGQALNKQIKAWRTKFFVFLTDREVPATSNISEREIRPSVVFRKVTNGFRSDWGAQIHAGYRSVTGTARLGGQPALQAIRDLIHGKVAVA
jgi:hypothetical protein